MVNSFVKSYSCKVPKFRSSKSILRRQIKDVQTGWRLNMFTVYFSIIFAWFLLNFFSQQKWNTGRSESKSKKTQFCFVSIQLRDISFHGDISMIFLRKFIGSFCLSKFHSWNNNEKLQPVGLIKNGVLQVLSSWENQTVV